MTPLLEIVTRHRPNREALLAQNQDSLKRQTDSDWIQTLLVDPIGAGVPAANRMLGLTADGATGEWIWVLDDDDICVYDDLVRDVRRIARSNPGKEVIMVRNDVTTHTGSIVPKYNWQLEPMYGDVSMSCFIVRNFVWKTFKDAWPLGLAGDYNFISAIWSELGPDAFYWHDVIAMQTLQLGGGK